MTLSWWPRHEILSVTFTFTYIRMYLAIAQKGCPERVQSTTPQFFTMSDSVPYRRRKTWIWNVVSVRYFVSVSRKPMNSEKEERDPTHPCQRMGEHHLQIKHILILSRNTKIVRPTSPGNLRMPLFEHIFFESSRFYQSLKQCIQSRKANQKLPSNH